MKRVFHPYWDWEDYQAGMWATISGNERIDYLRRSIEFTGDSELYGSFMQRVINEWPIACEHNLTDISQNRKAWIGHAAVCLAFGCPEDITRQAWGQLTQQQQDDANAEAQYAIEKWEWCHEVENKEIRQQMDLTGLPGRHSGRSAASIRNSK